MAQIATSTVVGNPIGEVWGLLRDLVARRALTPSTAAVPD